MTCPLIVGGHLITTTDCYRRTRQFVQTFMPKMGITCTVLDPSDYDGLEKAWGGGGGGGGERGGEGESEGEPYVHSPPHS